MSAFSKRKLIVLALSLLHALFLLGYTWYWLSKPKTYGDEEFLIKWSSAIKRTLFQIDDKPDPSRLLFVDVAGFKQLTDHEDEIFEKKHVITNRQLLGEVLQLAALHGGDSAFVLLDVLLDRPTEDDSLLLTAAESLGDRLLTISAIQEDGSALPPAWPLPHAVASYVTSGGTALKFPLLWHDSLPTVPLAMYQQRHQATFEKKSFGLATLNGAFTLVRPIVEYRVRPADFEVATEMGQQTENYTMLSLGELAEMQYYLPEEEFKAIFGGKFILFGDFTGDGDKHSTLLGDMPGTLILLNTYLNLVHGETLIKPLWLLMLLAGYFLLSWWIISGFNPRRPAFFFHWLQNTKSGHFFASYLNYPLLLMLLTLCSYFLFNIHINILYLAVYLNTFAIVLGNYREGKYDKWLVKLDLPAQQRETEEVKQEM